CHSFIFQSRINSLRGVSLLDTHRTRPYGPRAFWNTFLDLARPKPQFGDRMTDDEDAARRLAELEDRLQKARGQRRESGPSESPPSKLGIAFRLVTELVAAVLVGGGIGWALDRLFGTTPFLLIVMFLLGVAAGIVTVIRTARQMEEDQRRGRG